MDIVPELLEVELFAVVEELYEVGGPECDGERAMLVVPDPWVGGAASIEARDGKTPFCWDMPPKRIVKLSVSSVCLPANRLHRERIVLAVSGRLHEDRIKLDGPRFIHLHHVM